MLCRSNYKYENISQGTYLPYAIFYLDIYCKNIYVAPKGLLTKKYFKCPTLSALAAKSLVRSQSHFQ